MDNEQELWAEYDRAMAEDDFDTARRILDRIPPLSDEEWRRKLDEAPLDDEPVSPRLRKKLDDLHESLVRSVGSQAG